MFIPPPRHQVERVRQEPKRRTLTVTAVYDISPRMRRIVFTSPELADFSSPAPDDHIKLFLPDADAPSGEVLRDYTPRRFDPERRLLTIDFARHEAGPATRWAQAAAIGDTLAIGGPKGSTIVPDDFDWYLLVGDETALPSIGRRLEGLRAGVPVTSIVVIESPAEVQSFDTAAGLSPTWVFRSGRTEGDARLLREALARWRTPPGAGYAWIAAEAEVARTLKAHLLEERGHPKAWLKASGYWVRGAAGASEKMAG
ncbi:siderophore-interacting protein [Xanthobacter agilis]|uniref:siderophore-interacting protein n=1 Tax=Xanthobacter agilis TaxID=47492 RepID=UPI00372CB936